MASLLPFTVKDKPADPAAVKAAPAASGAAKSTGNGDSFFNNLFKEEEADSCLPALSRKQRVIGFFGCLFTSVFCFVMAFMFLPMIYIKARKFALLFSLGSLLSLGR